MVMRWNTAAAATATTILLICAFEKYKFYVFLLKKRADEKRVKKGRR